MVLSGRLEPHVIRIACALGIAACGSVSQSGPSPDGGAPPPSDTGQCFGTGIVRVCLDAAPIQPSPIHSGPIDTGVTSQSCSSTTNADAYCVIAGTTITITGALRATGSRPLVLVASESIMVQALIDVGSHRNGNPAAGAGADPMACATGTSPTTAAGTSGGGAGGSFTRLGGHGGDGATATNSGGLAGAAVLPANVTTLRGGCPGQAGAGASRTPGGHGGGAVYLIAGNTIDLEAPIEAGGEGGGGAPVMAQGGGGGGSGGMVGFDAPNIMIGPACVVFATGGGGGEASSDSNLGNAGADASATSAAAGGSGSNTNGGDGGAGSTGSPTIGINDGTAGSGNTDLGGGGGGGGGAGLVKVPAGVSFGSQAAPAPVH